MNIINLKKVFNLVGIPPNIINPTTVKKNKQISLRIKKIPEQPIIKVPWHKDLEAWAFIHTSEKYYFLKQRYFADTRKGYLIGSDSSCDIQVLDSRIEPRHCIIYAENYTEPNNECLIRVYLKDLSDPKCSTIISIDNRTVQKNANEPERLFSNNCIRFICPNSSKEKTRVFSFIIVLSPRMAAKSLKEEFKLGPIIGKGSFGTVMTVSRKDKIDKNCLAVKQINKNLFKYQSNALQQFTREISILMSLESHPGIVNIINVYDERDTFQILMEYIREGDLYTFIKETKCLSENVAKIIFRQLLSTVKFLHDAGVVHRDLKPENIMMASRKKLRVKICDFGLATLHRSLAELTSICGSNCYVAPEIVELQQYKKSIDSEVKSYGKECDLWSLGVILYGCLSGNQPFNRPEIQTNGLFFQSVKYNFNDPIWENISPEAKHLIARLLTVDRKKRITAEDALHHPWLVKDKK